MKPFKEQLAADIQRLGLKKYHVAKAVGIPVKHFYYVMSADHCQFPDSDRQALRQYIARIDAAMSSALVGRDEHAV